MSSQSARPRVVLDTDTFNEVDDQFALAHLLLAPDVVDLEAVYAAPFQSPRTPVAAVGIEQSYEEIHRVIDLVAPATTPAVFRGSTRYLPGALTPVVSAAAEDLVERAMATQDGRLQVLAIAAATNVASALLLEPRIAERIEIVWLGGHGAHWPHTQEFNLQQDLHAARVLFDTNVPLVWIPCYPVASHIITTVAELEKRLAPFSRLGHYLTEIVRNYVGDPPGWSKVIWDISASAWLITPQAMAFDTVPSPVLGDDLTWQPATGRRPIRVVREVKRNIILADFFARAAQGGQHHPAL